MTPPFKRIAIVTATGLGDLITLTPVIRRLKEEFPVSRIKLYTRRLGPIAESELTGIDAVGMYRAKTVWPILCGESHDILVGWGAQANLSGMHEALLYTAFMRLFPARQKLYYRKADLRSLSGKDIVRIKLELLQRIGIELRTEDARLTLPFNVAAYPPPYLPPLDGANPKRRLVVFHIGAKAGHTSRFWSTERWVAIARYLQQEQGARLAFIGTTDEIEETRRVLAQLDVSAVDLVGRLSIGESAALIGEADLMVSTNSGPMWIAAALGKPQVALCGPSRPEWEPCHDAVAIVRKAIDRQGCSPPCDRALCAYGDRLCMESITIEDVIEVLKSLHW